MFLSKRVIASTFCRVTLTSYGYITSCYSTYRLQHFWSSSLSLPSCAVRYKSFAWFMSLLDIGLKFIAAARRKLHTVHGSRPLDCHGQGNVVLAADSTVVLCLVSWPHFAALTSFFNVSAVFKANNQWQFKQQDMYVWPTSMNVLQIFLSFFPWAPAQCLSCEWA